MKKIILVIVGVIIGATFTPYLFAQVEEQNEIEYVEPIASSSPQLSIAQVEDLSVDEQIDRKTIIRRLDTIIELLKK